ncbi:hypothetical protein [Dactylosporangium salmoneum]|uniref:Lipoprotein n=1 Tax=Dactylosporangium salmoneum TaxID=53361 RepID=A0ABP5SH87_9ACTN
MKRASLLAVVLVVLAGCARGGGAGPGEEGLERLRRQADEALARYDKAVADAGGTQRFAPVGELTGQVGDWEAQIQDGKAALLTGRVITAATLPEAPQPTGEVIWAAGARQTLPLISAGEALRQLVAAAAPGDCGNCRPLEVTGARLGTTAIRTTRGDATAPAWQYTIKGSAVLVTRVAVAASAAVQVVPPSWDPYNAPGGMAIESATASADGKRLTVKFTGAPRGGDQPCGSDYTAEAVESDNAVVVIVVEHPHAPGEACTAIGAPRSTTVDLAKPLGDRAVLEVQQGTPVPVTTGG